MIALVIIIVLAVFPLPLQSGSGTVSLEQSPANPSEGLGWEPFNASTHGTLTVAWQLSSSSSTAGIVVVAGACQSASSCAAALGTNGQNALCSSPLGDAGATSGDCIFISGGGTYTVLGVVLTGYESEEKITFSFTVSAPLL